MTLLEVEGLCIGRGRERLVGPVDLQLEPGQRRALVGASGSGKSLTAAAVLGMLPSSLLAQGSVRWRGRDVLGILLSSRDRALRDSVSVVSQDPQRSLNPQTSIGRQIETALGHARSQRPSNEALELLEQLALDDPEAAWFALPHQLSGGQCQRACLAAALARRPDLLVADEPTTALDALTQHQVLLMLNRLLPETSALLFITHDMAAARLVGAKPLRLTPDGVIEERIVEISPADAPRQRVSAHTRPTTADDSGQPAPLVDVRELTVRHPTGRRTPPRTSLDSVSLQIRPGERIGLVGASGAGKSTLVHAILGLQPRSGGSVRWTGREVDELRGEFLRDFRRRVQFVPQAARGSLEPRTSALGQVMEPLRLLGRAEADPRGTAERLLSGAGLPQERWGARPRELSGGQCQRVAIARALATAPDLLIADEPLSGLDPDSRAGLEALLDDVLASPPAGGAAPALLLISHDLDSVDRVCERVIVLDAGRVAEDCRVADLLAHPESEIASRLVEAHCLTAAPAA